MRWLLTLQAEDVLGRVHTVVGIVGGIVAAIAAACGVVLAVSKHRRERSRISSSLVVRLEQEKAEAELWKLESGKYPATVRAEWRRVGSEHDAPSAYHDANGNIWRLYILVSVKNNTRTQVQISPSSVAFEQVFPEAGTAVEPRRWAIDLPVFTNSPAILPGETYHAEFPGTRKIDPSADVTLALRLKIVGHASPRGNRITVRGGPGREDYQREGIEWSEQHSTPPSQG